MAYEKLNELAKKLGYTHLSLEFLEEMRGISFEYQRFMSDGRMMFFGTDDQDEINDMVRAPMLTVDIEGEPPFIRPVEVLTLVDVTERDNREHEKVYAPGELIIDDGDSPTTGFQIYDGSGQLIDEFPTMDEAQKFVDDHTGVK